LSVVDAFADLVLRDDFAVITSVFLAFVRRFPDGAGHTDRAESLGRVANRRRRRLALLRNVALHLFANFAGAATAVVFRGEGLSHTVRSPIIGTFVVRLALRRIAVYFVNSVNNSAGTIAIRIIHVGETTSGFV